MAAYADDFFFFLSRPVISIPNLMTEFTHYGYISNMQINYSKSEAMNISLPVRILSQTKANSPFKWDVKTLKYLGVWLTPRILRKS